jgi:hypothetical protein
MIVVKVELHSAITHEITELGRMIIHNVGGTRTRGDYGICVGRKGQGNQDILQKPQRLGKVRNHARLAESVWCLVAKALAATRYSGPIVAVDTADDTNGLVEP